MLIGTKVFKPCPICGRENEIQHDITKNSDKYWYHCNGDMKHVNKYIERNSVADVIDHLDKLLVGGEE